MIDEIVHMNTRILQQNTLRRIRCPPSSWTAVRENEHHADGTQRPNFDSFEIHRVLVVAPIR